MLSSVSWASVFLPVPTPDGALFAPDACRAHMVQEVLDPSMRLNLSLTCTEGRRWVVQTANNASLTLNLKGRPSQVQTRVKAAKAALQTRGCKPTALVLQHARDGGVAAAQQAVAELHVVLGHITQLCLDFPVPPTASTALATLLSTVAAACPRLHTLQLTDLRTPLPSLPLLPHITHLAVSLPHCNYHDRQAIVDSCKPYMPQLTTASLSPIQKCDDNLELSSPVQPNTLLSAPLPNLTSLTLDTQLDTNFLGLLLQHAPAVRTLGVQSVCFCGPQHAQKTWAVDTLTVRDGQSCQTDNSLVLHLPLLAAGVTTISVGGGGHSNGDRLEFKCNLQGSGDQTFLERLTRFRFTTLAAITLLPHSDVAHDPDTACQALAHTLATITELLIQHPNTPIDMLQWRWTSALSRTLSAAAHRLPHHPTIHVHTDIYHPDIATILRPCAWCVHWLKDTNLHGYNLVVPRGLERLPHLLDPQHQVPRSLRTLDGYCVYMRLDDVEALDTSAMQRHVKLLSNLTLVKCDAVTIQGPDPDEPPAPGALVRAFQLLGAARFQQLGTIEFDDFTLTPEAVLALKDLPPHWVNQTLVFEWNLKWVGEPGLYHCLPLSLGSRFRHWVLMSEDIPLQACKDLCQGLAWFRPRDAPLLLGVREKRLVRPVQEEVVRLGLQEWVTVEWHRTHGDAEGAEEGAAEVGAAAGGEAEAEEAGGV